MKKILFGLCFIFLCGCSNTNDYSKKELVCSTIEKKEKNVTEITTIFSLDKEGTIIKSCSNTQITYKNKRDAEIEYKTIKNLYSNSKIVDNVLNFTICTTNIDENYKNIKELMNYMDMKKIDCKLKDTIN